MRDTSPPPAAAWGVSFGFGTRRRLLRGILIHSLLRAPYIISVTTSSKFSVLVADLSCHLPFLQLSRHSSRRCSNSSRVPDLPALWPHPRDTSDDKRQSVRRSHLALSKTLPPQKSRLSRSDRHSLLSSVILEFHFGEGETCPCPPSCFRSITRPLPFGLQI